MVWTDLNSDFRIPVREFLLKYVNSYLMSCSSSYVLLCSVKAVFRQGISPVICKSFACIKFLHMNLPRPLARLETKLNVHMQKLCFCITEKLFSTRKSLLWGANILSTLSYSLVLFDFTLVYRHLPGLRIYSRLFFEILLWISLKIPAPAESLPPGQL